MENKSRSHPPSLLSRGRSSSGRSRVYVPLTIVSGHQRGKALSSSSLVDFYISKARLSLCLPVAESLLPTYPPQVKSMEDSVIPQIIPFDPTKKKKKKKAIDRLPVNDPFSSVCLASDPFGKNSIANGNEGEDGIACQVKCPWEGSDRDYHYQELLHRVYSLQNENIPELAGNKRRTFMKPAQVIQEGNMTTVLVNFVDLCNIMHRQPDHVMTFMLGEIGANGYLDGQRRFIVQGRFVPTNLEEILHRYIEEYVLCRICRSPDTVISADRHVYVLGCEQCGSERSLPPINLTQTRRQKILIRD